MNANDVLPKIYKDINQKGYIDQRNFKSFDDINQNYLWFIDLTWLSYDEIMQKEYESFHNIKMIPFAHTNGGDYWCFDLNQNDYIPIVCCYHDDGEAIYYAKTLEAALFRQILDFTCNEFSSKEIENECSIETGKKIIMNWISKLGKYFPHEWISELNYIISSEDYTLSEGTTNYVVMTSESKYDELIKKYINFYMQDKKFIWTKDVTKFY
jgi:hypothetical protein